MAEGERFPEVPSTLASRLPGLTAKPAEPGVDLGAEEPQARTTGEVLGALPEARRGQRYVSEGVIGRGGMGEVHRVLDTDLRRALAMKILLVEEPGATKPDPVLLARFLEEAQVTGQLDHPSIVPLHELGIDAQGRVYFTMRLVRGQQLGEVFEKARAGADGWSMASAVEALVKVADALAFAHAKGVVHRDLKPENIMAGRFGEVYLMDWGLAKVVGRAEGERAPSATATLSRVSLGRDPAAGSVTLAGQVCGTPAHMSPEQALGETERVDARSDIYSFGSILYELLAGHSPYLWKGAAIDGIRVVLAVRAGPPPPVRTAAPAASADLAAICQKAMARDPAERYQSMREVAGDLRAWLAGRPVSALPLNPLTRTLRWCHRYPWAAAALLAITLGAGYGWLRLSALPTDLGQRAAHEAASQEAASLERVTAFYSENILGALDRPRPDRVVKDDWTPADTVDGHLPLPATFLTNVARLLTSPGGGVEVQHYSDLPFRFRKDPHPLDAFEKRALEALRLDPKTPVEEVEPRPGGPVLRYATARVMTQKCVSCHNEHPDSPKTDWKVNDVRGVLEIVRPLNRHSERAREEISGTLDVVGLLILGLTGLAALTLLGSIRRERR